MFLLLIIAPILFNLTWLIDTYLTSRFGKEQKEWTLESSTWTLMIIWWIIALLVSIITWIFLWNDVFSISKSAIFMLLISWLLYGFAARPYFEALKIEKIENIIPFLQTIPIFTYIIANIALGENLSLPSIVLMCIIVLITWLFGRDIKTWKINFLGLTLILGCSLLYSSSFVLFKLWWWETLNIWTAYFREHIWVAFSYLLFLLSHRTRKTTLSYFSNNWIWFSVLNIWNELFYIVWVLIVNYLSLHYNIAFINTISNGLQPLLWFLMVFLAYKILPKIYEWDYSQKELKWKIILCIISFVLLFWFYKIQSV